MSGLLPPPLRWDFIPLLSVAKVQLFSMRARKKLGCNVATFTNRHL